MEVYLPKSARAPQLVAAISMPSRGAVVRRACGTGLRAPAAVERVRR
jgi:hypothetical protein